MKKILPLLAVIPTLFISSCQMSETGAQVLKQSSGIFGQVGGSVGSGGSGVGVSLGKIFDMGMSSGALTNTDISAAFKQALSIGTSEVVSQLGQTNGFFGDSQIKIPLPDKLARAQSFLEKAGMSSMLDDLQLRLNRAAEIATPHAKELFITAISDMTFQDVMDIYNGPQNSATQYFQGKTSQALMDKMAPFVNDALAQAGVVQSYDALVSQYNTIPFASNLIPDVKSELSDYVVGKGVEGIFYYLGEQEREIRSDPVRHTTDLLKKVFGSN